MPPCSCIAAPTTSTAAAHTYDFALDAATDESGSASATTASTAAPSELAAHRELDEHVGARVLDGLERADRPVELLAHADVRDGGVEHRGGEPEAVAGDRHRGAVERVAPTPAPASPSNGPDRRVGPTRDVAADDRCRSGGWRRGPAGRSPRPRRVDVDDGGAAVRGGGRQRASRSATGASTTNPPDRRAGPSRRRSGCGTAGSAPSRSRVGSDRDREAHGPVATSRSSSSLDGLGPRPHAARRHRARRFRSTGSSPRRGPSPPSTTAVSANVAPAPSERVGHLEPGPSDVDEAAPSRRCGSPRLEQSPSRSRATARSSSWSSEKSVASLTTRPRSARVAGRARARR